MRKLARFTATLAIGALALGLSGCGNDKSSTPTKGDSNQVTIVTNGSWTLGKESLAKAKVATGQEIRLVNGEESGTLDSKLILRKDSPLGDLAVGLTTNNVVKVAKAGVIAPSKVKVPSSAEKYLIKEAEGALPLDRSDVCANYDIAYFKDHNLTVPENFDDLLKPEYKGLTVIENPAKSDTGLGMLLATVQEKGKDGYLKYWKDLMANGSKAAASFLGYRPFLSAAAAAEFGMEIGEREQLAIAPGGLKMCLAGQGVAANARDLRVRRGKYLAEVSWQQGSEEYLGQAEAGLGLHLSKKQTLQAVGLQIQRSETCVVPVSS